MLSPNKTRIVITMRGHKIVGRAVIVPDGHLIVQLMDLMEILQKTGSMATLVLVLSSMLAMGLEDRAISFD